MAGVDVAKFSELLRSLLSSDNNVRQQAEKFYAQAKATEADSLFIGFLSVFANQGAEEQIRRQACVLLRQLTSTSFSEKEFVWGRVQPQTRQQVAQELLRLFESEPNPKLQKKLGDVIAKMAECTYDTENQNGYLAPGQPGWPALPMLVFKMADASQNQNVGSCESGLVLLKGLVGVLKQEMMTAQQQVGVVLQAGLGHADMKVKSAALQLVCEMVTVLEKKAWAALLPTAPLLIGILQQMAQVKDETNLNECIQAFLEVAQIEPDFFKGTLQQSMEPAKFFSGLTKSKDQIDGSIRNIALEWLVVYVEQKPKWLTKSLPDMPPLVLECCMHMMLEVEDGQQELKEWMTRMDDEEGEEDVDEFFHEGEEAIDRVAEALGMETIGKWLFQLIGHFSSQSAWQAKLAALSAVKQTVEYVEDTEHTNEMAKLLLSHVDHPHPRVRYTALHALGQLANDQAPHFQEAWHQTVMPVLLKKFDDEVDRVAAMAMSAFVSFGEELDNALMLAYSAQFMEKLVGRLKTTQHRMVQEESITSIAVVAAVMESDFSQYYDGMMPMLKQLVMHATSEKEGRLRGKAFECMSLLGLAVGKEKFLPDAKDAIFEMMKTQSKLAPDDIQREYITEASERVCKCLKDDFAIFLPHMLPMLFQSLKFEAEDVNTANMKGKQGEDDEYINVMTGDGKTVKVRTSKFEELLQSLQLMSTFCEEMDGAYFDWVQQTAQAVLPLLSTTDEVSLLCDEVRSTAFNLWALLIKCAKSAAEKRGNAQGAHLAAELFKTILASTAKSMAEDDDPETLKDSADGIAECIKNAPPGVMQANDVLQFVQQVFKLIDDSLARTMQAEKRKKDVAADTPAGLQLDEDDEDKAQDDEESCRRSLEEILGSLMQATPMEFLPCLNDCGQRMGQWLSQPKNRTLGLWLACDMLNHLKDKSEPVWPVFMPTIFQAFADQDYDLRIAAFYAINLAAPIERFSEAAPEAFRRLGQYIAQKEPKKRDEKAKMARDNAVAALLALAKDKPQLCPQDVPAWQLVLSKLPLRDDEDEAKKVHKTIAELVLAQNMGLLGQDGSNMGKVLSLLAEVYHQENICEKETDKKINQVFTMVPRDQLMKFAGSFSEKQQRKIEKMLTSGTR